MKRILLSLVLSCTLVPLAAQTDDWQARLFTSLDSLCHGTLSETSQLGLVVVDLTDGVELFSLNARHRMRPASCQKIITTVVALDQLGADHLFSFADTLGLGWGWCWDDDWKPSDTLRVDTCLLSEAIIPMMKKSDNRLAEAVFRRITTGQGRPYRSRKDTERTVNEFIAGRLGLAPADYIVADGSGLSLYNYVTPQLLVEVLSYAARHENIRPYLIESLPIAGVDGTLSKRMRGTTAAGNLRAKTGTVEGVSSLAGYVINAQGHLIAFAIINQGIARGAQARAFQDAVGILLSE